MERHGREMTSIDRGLEGITMSAGGRYKALQQGGSLMRQGESAGCQEDREACISLGQQMQLSDTLSFNLLIIAGFDHTF